MLDLYGLPTKGLRIKLDTITTTGLNASGWVKRDKLLFVLIRIAGGGGDSSATDTGGGSAYCEKWYRGDELNSTEDVTVGIGGSLGFNGGDSVFKDMTAGGGKSNLNGGAGGTASGGDLNVNGNKSGTGEAGGTSVFFNFGSGGLPGGVGANGIFIAWNFVAGE